MGHLNEIHNAEGYKVISGFGNIFVCDDTIEANKTIIFPDGWNNDTNLSFKVIFKYGHNCADDQTHMTLNSIPIVVNQYGTLIPLPIHEMDDSGTIKYKSLQPNTILEMYYTNDYDGNNNPAFVVIGNPIVLSSADYTYYADGYMGEWVPDWDNQIEITTASNTWTAPCDCWCQLVYYSANYYLTLNGKYVSVNDTSDRTVNNFLGIVRKGDVLVFERSNFSFNSSSQDKYRQFRAFPMKRI